MQKKRFLIGRKGQITLFFIVGLLLVAIFAFFFYSRARTGEADLQAPTDKLISDTLKTGPIPVYVGLCIENVTKQALVLAGEQGGNIYQDQGGTALNPTRYVLAANRVSYGISQPFTHEGTAYPPPPGYPGGEGRFLQVPYINFNAPGRFGEVTLTRLCYTKGANSPLPEHVFGTGTEEKLIAVFCQAPYIYGDVLTTQQQLEQYIADKLPECTDWAAVQNQTGFNITNTTQDVNVTVRMGLRDLTVDVYIPLEIRVGGQEPIVTIGDFNARFPVRLKRLVELASFMSTYDSFLLTFNLDKDYTLFDKWDTDMKIDITTPLAALNIHEDVVTIEDQASVLDGQNYVFQFARQNRYPVLDWIHHKGSNYTEYDIVVMENDTIRIDPNPDTWINNLNPSVSEHTQFVYDPDEDELTYYYTGWKSTCDEKYNFDLNIPNTACSDAEPTRPELYFEFPGDGKTLNSEWGDSLSWRDFDWFQGKLGVLGNTMSLNEAYPNIAPMNWTSSPEYDQTGRIATFTPSKDDIGPHNVTVWVCDEGGLCDYQIVRILVIDYPVLDLNGTNPYASTDPSIPHDAASVEDFYRFSSEGTTGYVIERLGLIQGYKFTDPLEPFEILLDDPYLKIADIPRTPPPEAREIQHIINYDFKRSRQSEIGQDNSHSSIIGVTNNNYPVYVNHTINLSIPNLAVPHKQMNVSVYQCLPYRNAQNPEIMMWPYNGANNPYIASHMCCSKGSSFRTAFDVAELKTDEVPVKIDMVNEYGSDVVVKIYQITTSDSGVSSEEITGDTLNGYDIEKNENSISITFPNYVIEGTFEIEQSAPDSSVSDSAVSSYPPWGAWMGTDTVCFEQTPRAGLFIDLLESDITGGQENVGTTDVQFKNLDLIPGDRISEKAWTWFNDVVAMSFKRTCSGVRGNVCDGEATLMFEQVSKCKNMNKDSGEIESCNGPAPEMSMTSMTLDTSIDCDNCKGICYESHCYILSGNSGCVEYPRSGQGRRTFEEAFGLERTGLFKGMPDSGKANGTCNPTPTCSDSKEQYDVSDEEGRFIIYAATCKEGSCSAPYPEKVLDCESYNGKKSTSASADWICESDNDQGLKTTKFECSENEDGKPACVLADDNVDADYNTQTCNACKNAEMHNGGPVGSACCGDDIGEGGYKYSGNNAAHSNSDNINAGLFEAESEIICDDYYGSSPLNKNNWIDNDCDDLANCLDPDCAGKRGPGGDICCTYNDDCEAIAGYDENIGCGNNKFCVCNKISKDLVSIPDSFCLPAGGSLSVQPLSVPDMTGISFSSEFLDGSEPCNIQKDNIQNQQDQITGIKFTNTAEKACVVTKNS